jgi:hypothetical protein
MSVPASAISPVGLHAEWERLEVLALCLQSSRRGGQPDSELINRLQELQRQVDELRNSADSPWRRLPVDNLPPLAVDVLACIYAPEAQPRVGWHYQDLQQGSPQPHITPALIQLLLALDQDELHLLQQLVADHGELKRRQLIESDGEGAFVSLRPVRNALARLLQWNQAQSAPPGAYPVRQRAGWDDLVLPDDRERLLSEYMMWLRHRPTVVERWGGSTVGGPLALFSGPTGTGKTFAASVIAGELGWPLYRVDLARLVSKYIGETEKNIGRLFDAAHGQEMVLQFDEVDALMSKRGEIKEARDRYANMEVSYLLARVEDHDGPCILTTNLRNQIDKAFSRRFQVVVEFPRPDKTARAKLWRRMLPPRAPLAERFDFDFLADAVNLTGGNIRNAALHAAYLAAEEDRPIDFSHIAVAVYRELAKDRQQLKKTELGPLAAHLPTEVCPT